MKGLINIPENMLSFKANTKDGVAPRGRPKKVSTRFEKETDYSDDDEDGVFEEYVSPIKPRRYNDEGSDIDEEANDLINQQIIFNENSRKDGYITSNNESDNDHTDDKEQSKERCKGGTIHPIRGGGKGESSSSSNSRGSGSINSDELNGNDYKGDSKNGSKGGNKDGTSGGSRDISEGENKDVSKLSSKRGKKEIAGNSTGGNQKRVHDNINESDLKSKRVTSKPEKLR
jgi:hypothetical protein